MTSSDVSSSLVKVLAESVFSSGPSGLSWPRTLQENLKSWSASNERGRLSTQDRVLKHMIDFTQYLIQAKKEFQIKFNQRKKMNDDYHLEDFNFFHTLGKGTFGRVMRAEHLPTSLHYAIKLLDKGKIVKYKQVTHVRDEIVLLYAVNFEFITDLKFSFMSNAYICLGMPFFNDGDLFGYLRKQGYFDEEEVQFYAGQMVLALEYLHFLGIVFRDLKPENILFGSSGYLKLCDFGFAKKIDDARTYTLCGTPDYLAPEILRGKGYGKAVDWWSFGILVYEMAAGQAPFYNPKIIKTYDKILRGHISYPLYFSKSLKNFLDHVIEVDITKRYGMLKNGIVDIKSDEWFQHFKWDELFTQSLKPYYTSKIDSNFTQSASEKLRKTTNSISDPEQLQYVDEFKDFE